MAALSNITKYTIDGVEIPVYPSSISPSHNLVSKSWNDMYGVFKDIPVNSKLKINWIFDYISESDLNTLWGEMIYNKIISSKSRFFEINSYFPGLGFVSGTFYLGTPTNFSSKDWETSNGKPNWFTCELHWIEVDGIKLNSPTAMPDTQKILVNNKEIYIRDTQNIADIIRNT